MSKPKKPESQAFGLRLSVALAERVKALAEENKRTFNGQLVRLLEVGLSATTGERAQVSETWGHSLATSAALAASEAARDAVLRVAREFDDAFTLATADSGAQGTPERRAEADRRAASADPDPDPPLPPGVLPVDVYPTDNGVKLGTRTKQRRSTPKPL